jgi:hypothetical protein
MPSASNERQIAARKEQQRRDRLNDELITGQLMSTVEGRRWVWRRLEEGALFQEDADLDPYRMAYAKGVRNVTLRLLKDVQSFSPQAYITMTEEAKSILLHSTPQEEPEDE